MTTTIGRLEGMFANTCVCTAASGTIVPRVFAEHKVLHVAWR